MTSKDQIPILVVADMEDVEPVEALPGESYEEPLLSLRRKSGSPGLVGKVVDVDTETLKRNLDEISAKVRGVIENQTANDSGGAFVLDSFTVGLALHANGGFTLIAEVGVEASVQLTFQRRPPSQGSQPTAT